MGDGRARGLVGTVRPAVRHQTPILTDIRARRSTTIRGVISYRLGMLCTSETSMRADVAYLGLRGPRVGQHDRFGDRRRQPGADAEARRMSDVVAERSPTVSCGQRTLYTARTK